jgi:flagellar biogenesis protein FliO
MNLLAAARKRRISTRKVTTRARALVLALLSGSTLLSGSAVFSSSALAVEPAGGTPYPPGTAPQEELALGPDAPDASVDERGWLAPTSAVDSALSTSSTPGSSLLTLLALLLVAGLGGGALWLQRRKKAASPAAQVESRLTLLSSTRVGPKAFAVSAEVNGRVLLLGVTDHTVTHLGWLDPPELEATETAEEGAPDAAETAAPMASSEREDELPDDYPGSALRAAAAAQQSSLLPPASPLTSSQNLRRFQEVLRGAVPARPNPLRASSAPLRSELPSRPSLPLGSDAASTLAALTSDIVPSSVASGGASPSNAGTSSLLGGAAGTSAHPPSEPAPAGRSVAPASLRRKRQRRQEQLSKPPKASSKGSATETTPAELEGQVAGLRALKNG